MATYTIHQPPIRESDTAPDPERFIFVRDGFYFWAFVFGPLWILRHRLWLVLLAYLVLMAVFSAALWYGGVVSAAPAVHFLIAILLGLEAATLRRWTLTRRGWKNLGVVVGGDREAVERRFFDTWAGAEDAPATGAPPPVSSAARRIPLNPAPGVIGLFPEPGAPR